MKKSIVLAAGAALFIGIGTAQAHVECAFVCEETKTITCDGTGKVETVTSEVIQCENLIENPTAGCGQTCVDGTLLIGGWAGFAAPEGCIRAIEFGTDDALGGSCAESAVAACEAHGCAIRTPMEHPCAHTGYPQRGETTVDDQTGGQC